MDSNNITAKYGGTLTPALQAKPSSGSFSDIVSKYGGTVAAPAQAPAAALEPATGAQAGGITITGANASGAGSLGKALISSETGLGNDIAAGLSSILPKSVTGLGDVEKSTTEMANDVTNLAHLIKVRELSGTDTTILKSFLQNEIENMKNMPGVDDLYPALKKTNWQVAGDLAGTALDVLSSGSYGAAAKGAETGKLLTTGAKEATQVSGSAIAKNIEGDVVKPTLTNTLKTIGKETLGGAAIGGSVGYASDVSQNLKSGKEGSAALAPGLGTATGIAIPGLIGGVRAGVAIGREEAPRVINSLIKPKNANFSYGKDPGRAVSELGITGNSLPDFERNITAAKNNIGQQLGAIYANPTNEGIIINTEDDVSKIDDAIAKAAKGGKNNQTIVSQLNNVKDALLFEHGVNADGDIVKIGTESRNLTNLSPQEAQSLIRQVSDQTQFTGRPSDDKTVNSVLKNIYGGIREKINNAISPNNPEILKLNERYGDLTSAELAVKNRGLIVQRSNMIGLTPTIVGSASTIASLMSGAGDLKSILVGVGAVGLEKALASTAVKTRIASWLATQTPEVIRTIVSKNPQIVPIIIKTIPNIAAKLK